MRTWVGFLFVFFWGVFINVISKVGSLCLCFVPDLLTARAKFGPGHEPNSSEFWIIQSISLWKKNSTTLGLFFLPDFCDFPFPHSTILAAPCWHSWLPCPSTHQSLPQRQNHFPIPVTSCQWIFFIKRHQFQLD